MPTEPNSGQQGIPIPIETVDLRPAQQVSRFVFTRNIDLDVTSCRYSKVPGRDLSILKTLLSSLGTSGTRLRDKMMSVIRH